MPVVNVGTPSKQSVGCRGKCDCAQTSTPVDGFHSGLSINLDSYLTVLRVLVMKIHFLETPIRQSVQPRPILPSYMYTESHEEALGASCTKCTHLHLEEHERCYLDRCMISKKE